MIISFSSSDKVNSAVNNLCKLKTGDRQVVYIPEFMCQQSSRDLVFQILSNVLFIFSTGKFVCKVVTYNSRAQWCENKVTGSEFLVFWTELILGGLRAQREKSRNGETRLPATNQCFISHVPLSLSHSRSVTHTFTQTHSETNSPNHIQNKKTGDFWFQYRPPTVTPRMVHYHANHAKNNENVFI